MSNSCRGARSMRSSLKLAREAINNKDFNAALSYAEAGIASEDLSLDHEKTSNAKYTLLVFKALALHNLGHDKDAIETYETAALLHPNQPLAWQGLLNLYEVGHDDNNKFTRPLEHLATIYKTSKESRKHFEVSQKLLNIYRKTKAFAQATKLIEWFLGEEATSLYSEFLEILPSKVDCLLDLIEMVELQNSDHVNKEVEKRRFRLGAGPVQTIRSTVEEELAKTSKLDSLYEEVLKLLTDDDPRCLDIQLKLVGHFKRKIPGTDSKDELCQKLLNYAQPIIGHDAAVTEIVLDLMDSSSYSKIPTLALEHYLALSDAKYTNAVLYLLGKSIDGMDSNATQPSSVFFKFMTCKYHSEQLNSQDLIIVISSLRELISSMSQKYNIKYLEIARSIDKMEAFASLDIGKYELAKQKLEALPDQSLDVKDALLTAYQALGDHEDTINLLRQRLADEPHNFILFSKLGWELFLVGQLEDAKHLLLEAKKHFNDDSDLLFKIGRLYWEYNTEETKAQCLEYLLMSVKANPDNANSFLYLGLYYNWAKDELRAEKCFNKALRLDEELVDAAVNLARLWISKAWNDEEAKLETAVNVVNLLEGYTSEHLRNWKLWKFLGIAHSWRGEKQKAVNAFQCALKGEKANELECLELLAEAYHKDQKMTAALKAYSRALTVDPNSTISKIGHATILMETGRFEQAIQELETISASLNDSLKTPVQALLGKALSLYFYELALAHSQFSKALEILNKCLSLFADLLVESDCFIGWKTCSDILFSLSLYRKREDIQALIPFIDQICSNARRSLPENSQHFENINSKLSLSNLVAAGLCYLRCFSSLTIDQATLRSDIYSDLAYVYFAEQLYCPDLKQRDELLSVSLDYASQALEINLANSKAWNLVGLVACEQGRFAYSQHAYIMALESIPVGSNASQTWMNLSVLYIRAGDIRLAAQSIEQAQVADVDDPLPWLAQSQLTTISTEFTSVEEKLSKEFEFLGEAVECSRSALSPESNYRFIQLGWEMLHKFPSSKKSLLDQMDASLQKLINIDSSNPWSLNTAGLVKELLQAEPSFAKDLFRSSASNVGSKEEAILNSINNNLSRSLTANGDYSEALEHLVASNTLDWFRSFLKDLCLARIKNNSMPLQSYLEKTVFESHQSIWELAVWESTKIELRKSNNVETLLEAALQLKPYSLIIMTLKLINAVKNDRCEDQIEAILLQALEIASDSTTTPDKWILQVLMNYLCGKACFVEAFEFLMAIIENHISNYKLREFLVDYYHHRFRENPAIASDIKEKIAAAIQDWLDIQIPQLQTKPTMEELQAWHESLFPPTPPIDKSLLSIAIL